MTGMPGANTSCSLRMAGQFPFPLPLPDSPAVARQRRLPLLDVYRDARRLAVPNVEWCAHPDLEGELQEHCPGCVCEKWVLVDHAHQAPDGACRGVWKAHPRGGPPWGPLPACLPARTPAPTTPPHPHTPPRSSPWSTSQERSGGTHGSHPAPVPSPQGIACKPFPRGSGALLGRVHECDLAGSRRHWQRRITDIKHSSWHGGVSGVESLPHRGGTSRSSPGASCTPETLVPRTSAQFLVRCSPQSTRPAHSSARTGNAFP